MNIGKIKPLKYYTPSFLCQCIVDLLIVMLFLFSACDATPVLNTPDFSSVFGGSDGRTLKLTAKNLIEEVEFIAMPHTVFIIEEEIIKGRREILKVSTKDYPHHAVSGYYIDSRFVEKRLEKPQERRRKLPDKNTIIKRLLSADGAIYVWGGNYSKGIPEMLEFYKPSGTLPDDVLKRWTLKGVDCSGLLYEATGGYTPRNTDSLFSFGRPVDVKGLSPDEIAKKLKPLDIIVYKRHVLIVLNSREVIESAISRGVHVKNLLSAVRAVSEIMQPANDYKGAGKGEKFVVRRWFLNSRIKSLRRLFLGLQFNHV
ncbi:MAG: peptidoglycan endopeptidase [Nitrospirae bacterium]|nr:peptidoglycan endopeptidase [Nitrospirota bacterium]